MFGKFFKKLFEMKSAETDIYESALYKKAAAEGKVLPLFLYTQAVMIVSEDKKTTLFIEHEKKNGQDRYYASTQTVASLQRIIEDSIRSNAEMLDGIQIKFGMVEASAESRAFVGKAFNQDNIRIFLKQRKDIEDTIDIFEREAGIRIKTRLGDNHRQAQRKEHVDICGMDLTDIFDVSSKTRHDILINFIDCDDNGGKTAPFAPNQNQTTDIAQRAAAQNIFNLALRN